MGVYFWFPLLFINIIVFRSTFSTMNTTRYLLDKDCSYNLISSYKELCLDSGVGGVSCTILMRDIVNNFYSNGCFLLRVKNLRIDLCYYFNISGTSIYKPTVTHVGSYTTMYPYFCDISSDTPVDTYSEEEEAINNPSYQINSLMEVGNDSRYDKCMIMINEICRVDERFSSSLDSLIKGDKFSILSIFARRSPLTDKINYNLHKDLDVYVPSSQKFQNYLLSVITDQLYIHKNEMLKKLEYSLKFRECVLLNELDLLFFNITQFPLNLYKELTHRDIPI